MANTKRNNVSLGADRKDMLTAQIENLYKQLKTKLEQYKKTKGSDYPISLVEEDETEPKTSEYEYVNSPAHYVQEDGRQTWERMLDLWSKEEVALWCEMTVFKYEDRLGKKPNESEDRDLGKITWYKNKAEELRKETKKSW